ncbi:mixed lineage kinase domain-like protein [Lytechinus pictus]|uniref:mixed lineage kinase domain-like protein n=1 Tax=Lytechinus pictus TaxID=7653 RepID=UPI0030BA03B0
MSVVDILSGVGSLCELGLKIYEAAQQVKSFKSQSKTLSKRVQIILIPVKALQKEAESKNVILPELDPTRPDGVGYDYHEGPMMYIRPLKELQDCMTNIEIFLLKLGGKTWLDKFVHKQKIQDNFDSYNDQLTTLQQSLGFSLQAAFPKIINADMRKQLSDAFDKDKMEKQKIEDLEEDLKSIKADLEDLKQSEKDQSQDIDDIKGNLKLIYEAIKTEFERLNKDIQFIEQLAGCEKYASELSMNYTEFTDLETLEEGTYGPIIKTKHKFEDKMLVIKAFEDKELSTKKELKEQLNLWKNLRFSSYIVQLYGYTMDYESRMCFVVEYMSHGTLRSVLQDKENHPLPWEQRIVLARDCAQGLHAIHFGQGTKIMLHRAVTSTRFLVDGRYRAKISDNGFVKSASKISKSKSTMSSGGRGSVEQDEMNYLCPEETSTSFKRSIKSEVYKFGVILYEIASRMRPFEATELKEGVLTPLQKHNKIKDGIVEDPPTDTPGPFKDLILLCRHSYPNKRPATDAVVAHLCKMC